MMATRTFCKACCSRALQLCLVLAGSLVGPIQAATPHLEAGVQAARESQMDVEAQQQLQNSQLTQPNAEPQGFNLQMQRTDKTPIKKSLDDLQFNVTEVDFDGNVIYTDAALQ